MIGKLLYGALFVVALPVLLIVWAHQAGPNITLPVYGGPLLGWPLACAGLVLILVAMWELWRYGGGLPMNAFPPPKLVSRGSFGWIPHPIYTGFTLLTFGVSMAVGSAAGLWLVTPVVALACTALVWGYEHPDLQRRFGQTLPVLPSDDAGTPPSDEERTRFVLLVILPWIALYEATVNMRLPGFAFVLPFEDRMPVFAWTIVVYWTSYLTVFLAPWCARSRRDLRRLTVSSWVSIAAVFFIYWMMPSRAPRPYLPDTSWATHVLHWERTAYPPTAAFPSFHVLWAILVGRLYRPQWLGPLYVALIAVSCVTTGQHYILDVLAALAISPLLLEPERPWRWMRSAAECIANSWTEWRIGRVRIINHVAYAGLAAFVQVAIVTAAVGPGHEWAVLATALAGLIGAEAWAQWVEGSSRLRRPFGFYGGFIAVGLACLCFSDRWTLLAAHCLGAPWMQAIGRLRCLVNGCCHGSPAPEGIGIRVTDPRSRVTRLSKFGGLPIHPTQLYSIVANVIWGLLLARLWFAGCSLSLIAGVYAIGGGLSRFVEEAYRGEPQTPCFFGLRLYQWIAVGMLVLGTVLTSLPASVAPPLVFTPAGIVWGLIFGLVSATAMGVDFPESNRPLARLT
jgi:protein-S-isoprenylcysteine O-methyltransferase Ste14